MGAHGLLSQKRLAAVLVFFIGVLLMAWFAQLFFLDDVYQFLKKNMVKSALVEVSNNIDENNLDEIISKIQSAGIEVRIVDSNGVDRLNTKQTSLAEYTTEQLIDLYQDEISENGIMWEHLTKFDVADESDEETDSAFYKDSNTCRMITCAQLVKQKDGTELLVLMRSIITQNGINMDVMWTQMLFLSITLLLLAFAGCLFLKTRFNCKIGQYKEVAQELAVGNFNVCFPVQGCSSMKDLGESLNCAVKKFSETEQNREGLLANISHDLRAPLTMMIGYAQMMQEIPGENTPENVQIMIDEANRLSMLVNDILDLSKMKEAAPRLKLETFCLTDLLQETVYHYQKLTAQKQWEISFEKDRRVWVRADQTKISRVIYNFICNAINHTGQDKKIRVQQLVQDKKVFVRVTDNGPGIAEDKISSIWDRYYRIEQGNRTSAAEGSGLGLCIVKNILQQHQAEYGVESKQNQGSTFWFALEVLDQQQTEKFVKKQNQ